MFCKTISLFALVLAASTAFAAPAAKEPFALKAESTAEFRAQAQTLRQEMQAGRYANLKSKDKKRVDVQLDKLDALYVKRTSGGKIYDADAIALVNASSEINNILVGNDEDRLICEQVKTIGSNRVQKVCMTAAQRAERHAEAQRDLRERNIGGRATGN